MAATTIDRNTLCRRLERQLPFDLASGQDIPAGVMVCTNASGEAVSATDTAGLFVQGRAEHRAKYADGDRKILVSRGVFCWANDGTIAKADIGQVAMVLDNQTVTKAATAVNDIGAGIIEDVTSDGVWVASLGGRVAAT